MTIYRILVWEAKMKVIGLTGPSGAGKSTLCEKFAELGIPCINTDEIYHSITNTKSACLDELCQKFGTSIIDNDGALDRVALSKLVFEGENAKANLASLNETTHKYVFEETKKLIDQYLMDGKAAVVIDAPALFSSKLFVDACDFIISALCDRDVRIERIMKRDNISIERAQARINSQPSDDFFIENSDYHILNCAKNDETYAQLFAILKEQNICK
jgi:dephospho-CoA kinase